jgi:hypothetical protein
MALTKAQLKTIGEKNNWKRAPLTAYDVQRMGSTEFDWNSNFNRLNLETAMRKPAPGVPSPASLGIGGQIELARRVLARYRSYVHSPENAKAMDAYLQAIPNPQFTEAEVVKAFEENCAAGLLRLQLPNGRIVSGRDIATLDSATYQTLVTPTTPESVRERTMSSEDWKRAHVEDFAAETPALIQARYKKAIETIRQTPRFAGLQFTADDTKFVLAEMQKRGLSFTYNAIEEILLDNIARFERAEVA